MKTPGQRQLITLQEQVKLGIVNVDEAVLHFKEWQLNQKRRSESFRFQQVASSLCVSHVTSQLDSGGGGATVLCVSVMSTSSCASERLHGCPCESGVCVCVPSGTAQLPGGELDGFSGCCSWRSGTKTPL